MTVSKKWWLALWIAIIGVVIYIVIVVVLFLVMLFAGNNSCSSTDVSTSEGVASGATGDWANPGSQAYKTAKEVFDFWTKQGMSGAQAAGIVGNIAGAEDTGFVLDQKEIGGGSGGGLYQFTPYTKYLNNGKSDKSWSAQNQSEVVMALEPDTVKSYFSKTKSSSPADAATAWMNLYERPSEKAKQQSNSARQAAAEKIYTLFGGASISANDSLLGGVSDGASSGEQTQMDQESSGCSSSGNSVPGDWVWPFASVPKDGPKLVGTQNFGNDGGFRTNGFHDGVDFGDATYSGDIRAVHGGKIVKICSPNEYNLGFYLVWEVTDDGYGIAYQEFGDTSDISVKVGDSVNTGDKIGVSRPGGDYTHLHLGITKQTDLGQALSKSFTDDGTWLNPVEIIKKGLK